MCKPVLPSRVLMLEDAHEKIAGFLCNNHPDAVPVILDYMGVSASNDCFNDLIKLLRGIHEDRDLPRLTEFFLGFDDVTFVYNMLYDVFDGNVFDEIFGTSTYYPVLQQALFHCAPRTEIQNFFLAWAPFNMGVLRTVVGDAYLMYLVYNAYPSFFTTQIMDNIGVEEFYRAFERMANFNISDLMALLQNSMEPGKYGDFAASVPSFLSYEEKISLSEHYIYGSQRLGAKKATKQLQSHTLQYESGNWLPQEVNYMAEPVPAYVPKAGGLVDVGYALGTWLANGKLKYPQEATYTRKLGFKEYELTNHLGNVQATVLDRRLGVKANPSDTIFSYVEADVKTAQDYYPFGMMMPGRLHVTSASHSYRYGTQGWVMDDEISGKGNSYATFFRQHDPRIGRTWSMDPKLQYPSPYVYLGNNPMNGKDPDGAWFWEKSNVRQARSYAKATGGEFNKWRGVNGKTYASVGFSSATTNDLGSPGTHKPVIGQINVDAAVFLPGQNRIDLLMSGGVGQYEAMRATSTGIGGRYSAFMKSADAFVNGYGEYNRNGQPTGVEKALVGMNPLFSTLNNLLVLFTKTDAYGQDASTTTDQVMAGAGLIAPINPFTRLSKTLNASSDAGEVADGINTAAQAVNDAGLLNELKAK